MSWSATKLVTRVEIDCTHCKQVFKITPGRLRVRQKIHKNLFCSLPCYWEHSRKGVAATEIEVLCTDCHKTFYVAPRVYRARLKASRLKLLFCGHHCRVRYLTRHKLCGKPRQERLDVTCVECLRLFKVAKCKAKERLNKSQSKILFCSQSCANRFQRNNEAFYKRRRLTSGTTHVIHNSVTA